MRKLIKLVAVFAFASAIALTTARGQFSRISVDEKGIGFYNGLAAPLGSGFFPDPFNGGIAHFGYMLPFPWLFGAPVADIVLFEPGQSQPSDLLRFMRDQNSGSTLLLFYSDALPGDPINDPADVFGLPNPVNLILAAPETGLFGNPYTEAGPNGFVYFTGPGGPVGPGGAGWDGNPAGTEYTFISDVPEPGSSFLLAGGLGILWFKALRRKVCA